MGHLMLKTTRLYDGPPACDRQTDMLPMAKSHSSTAEHDTVNTGENKSSGSGGWKSPSRAQKQNPVVRN